MDQDALQGTMPGNCRFLADVGTYGHDQGECVLARDDEDRLARLLVACVGVLLILATCMFHYMPGELAMIVVSWAMLSISVGISFGHCVLNEP
jgi:hypothetical protein